MKDLLEEYHQFTKTTAIYPGADVIRSPEALEYLTLAFIGEVGEIGDKYKKVIRDNNGILSEETKQALSKEIGDVMYYISQMCNTFDVKLYNLVDVSNLDKIEKNEGIYIATYIRVLAKYVGGLSSNVQQYFVGLTGPRKLEDDVYQDIQNIAYALMQLAIRLDLSIEDIIRENMAKLQSRKDRGVISGSGDNR